MSREPARPVQNVLSRPARQATATSLSAACFAVLAMLSAGCSVGEGNGQVTSENLLVPDCWNGQFDLEPSFFAANPFENTVTLRIQRGTDSSEVSDGVLILLQDVERIREELLGQPIALGLPAGVSPPGFALQSSGAPPLASLVLYLNRTCDVQNRYLYALAGTAGSFQATVVSPADLQLPGGDTDNTDSTDNQIVSESNPGLAYPAARASELEGNFHFFFQRGSPGQPFP